MASTSPPSSPPPSPESQLRTSSRTMSRTSSRRLFAQSLSAIAVSDAVDATEICIEPRTAASSPQLIRTPPPSPAKETITLPVPSSPTVGPENFEKIRILGAGSTGRVYLVRSVGLGEEEYFAMKVVKKSELVRRNRVQRVLTERQILSVANHPFVVTLHYSFQTAEYFYLVMQYCAGGELFSFLRSQENHRLTESQARFYAAEVLIALEYLHMLGIIYRDLKPENILVHESGHVMLSDFDLAYEVKPLPTLTASEARRSDSLKYPKPLLAPLSPNISTTDAGLWFKMREQHQMNRTTVTLSGANEEPLASAVSPSRRRRFSCPCVCMPRAPYPHLDTESHMELGEKRTSFVGTHEYVAPEIISEEGYVGSVDWWAFGVLLYEMLFGTTPFRGKTQIQTLENILDICGEIEFPGDIPVGNDCKDLILKLLDRNASKRMQNPLVIKSHPFFKELIWPLIRHQQPPIIPPMVHSLQEKHFSQQEMVEFDDEVPFHRALSSPLHRQLFSHGSLSSNGSAAHLASIAQLSSDDDSLGNDSADEDKEEKVHSSRSLHKSPGSRKSIVGIDGSGADTFAGETSPRPGRSRSPSRVPSATAPMSRLPSSSSRAASQSAFAPVSPSSNAEPPPSPNMTAGVVHDFEFVANQRRSFWSSRESHRSLSSKMSQLDLATYTPHELRPERYGEDNDDEDDDEGGEATTVDLRGSISLGFHTH